MMKKRFNFASDVKPRIIENINLKLEIKGDVVAKMRAHNGFDQLVQDILAGVDEFMQFNDVKMDAILRFFQDPEWSKSVNLNLDVYLYIDDCQIRAKVVDNLRSYVHPKVKGRDNMELYFDDIIGYFWVINNRWG